MPRMPFKEMGESIKYELWKIKKIGLESLFRGLELNQIGAKSSVYEGFLLSAIISYY